MGSKTSMAVLVLACVTGLAFTPPSATVLKIGAFSGHQAPASLPDGWEPLTFKNIDRHTAYTLVQDDGVWVVAATSSASASGLIRRMEIDPHQFPVISWRWKVTDVLSKGDVTQKAGDDYPARVYITFAYDPAKLEFVQKTKYWAARLLYGEYPPTGTLAYIWANKAPVGTVVPNPYTDRVQMIVLQSGSGKKMQWIAEKRNVYEDYRMAFGHEPPLISGVALMTDTDNTGEAVRAYYGDILLSSK